MIRSLLARLLYPAYTWLCEGLEAGMQLGFDGTPARANGGLIPITEEMLADPGPNLMQELQRIQFDTWNAEDNIRLFGEMKDAG